MSRIITISSSSSCDFKTLEGRITKSLAKDVDILPIVYIFIYRMLISSLAEVLETKCYAGYFTKIVLHVNRCCWEYDLDILQLKFNCVKSVQKRFFFWSVLSCIQPDGHFSRKFWQEFYLLIFKLVVLIWIALTNLMPMVSFYTPWKHEKTRDILMLLRVMEKD